ncbi:MAG: M48 family metallopeptidase [Treponema sp.]|nr:M48 family metallopeptidase [Treponema sp.]
MKIRVNKKENLYFAIKVVISLLIAYLVVTGFNKLLIERDKIFGAVIPILIYVYFIFVYLFFRKIFIVGYLKGNGVEITSDQFPEIYQIYVEMAKELGMKKVPPLFLIQQGGALNAFAIRFSCKNYIAIYSDIFEMIETDIEVVKFILGHELGHVKRHHMSKQYWTFLASLVPFLGAAYSRSCEYTCDNIGHDLSEGGSEKGLLVLAAGKNLYKKVAGDKYIESAKKRRSFSVRFVELCSSHPFLPNRIKNIKNEIPNRNE